MKDKRLRIDLAALKQEIEKEDILVTWVPGRMMSADALSKKSVKKDMLNIVIWTRKLDI